MLDINVTLGETAAASDRALANNGASELNGCLETRYLNLRKEIEPVPSLAIVPDSYSSGVLFSQLPSHRTNFITNNTMQGAAPNVFPTGWSTSTVTLTATCISSGVENDIEYIDIQVSGTATSGFLNIRPNLTPSGIPAAVNDNFCGSIYYKLVSGTFPNLPNLQIQELNNGSFLSGSTVNTPATSTLTRVEVNRTMNQPTVNNVGIRWGHDATGTFNYVVRLGLPQLERGLKARDIIRTKGTLVSVYQSPTNIITQGGDFIVSRNTGATRVGPNGLIETGNTNLALQSEAWNVSPWLATSGSQGATVSGNVTTSPDGTTNADKLIESAVSGNHFCSQSLTLTSGTTYTASFFVKASERTRGRLRMLGSVAYWDLEFNLTSATVTGGTNSFIQNYGNGWYRIGATFTANQASNTFIVSLFDASGNNSYMGDGTSGFFVWGAQLEVGSSASEYIPTTTVARTRFAGVTVDGTIAANIPRIDWFRQSCPALLVEGAATNFARGVNQMTAQYTPTASGGMTITTGSTDFLAPDGTSGSITKYVGGAASTISQYAYYSGGDITVTAPGQHTFSLFVKRGATNPLTFCAISIEFYAGGSGTIISYFNLASGTALTAGASIQDYGNGWYRIISAPYTIASGDLSGNLVFFMAEGNNDTNWTASGALGLTAYTWGAQFEAGSVATSYIPTTTTTASRAADVISASGALVSGLIGQTEGTIYAEIDFRNLVGSPRIITVNDGTTDNRLMFFYTGTNLIFGVQSSGSTVAILAFNTTTAGIYKLAGAYKQNDFVFYVNGTQAATDTSGNVPVTLTRIDIGTELGYNFLNNRIRAAALYTTRLSDEQLQHLTSFYEPEYDNINLWNAFTERYSNPDPCLYNRLCALLY